MSSRLYRAKSKKNSENVVASFGERIEVNLTRKVAYEMVRKSSDVRALLRMLHGTW